VTVQSSVAESDADPIDQHDGTPNRFGIMGRHVEGRVKHQVDRAPSTGPAYGGEPHIVRCLGQCLSQCQHLGDSIDHGPSSPLMQRFNGEQPAVLPSAGTVVLMLVATILLTPFLNNAATVLVMAPIAASLARQ
jgi:hypothetical protein